MDAEYGFGHDLAGWCVIDRQAAITVSFRLGSVLDHSTGSWAALSPPRIPALFSVTETRAIRSRLDIEKVAPVLLVSAVGWRAQGWQVLMSHRREMSQGKLTRCGEVIVKVEFGHPIPFNAQ